MKRTQEEMLKDSRVTQHREEMKQLFKEVKASKKAVHPAELYRQKKLNRWGQGENTLPLKLKKVF